jgi:hypothetical protein
VSDQSALDTFNNFLATAALPKVADLSLPQQLNSRPVRMALGAAAKKGGWFKTIDAGERLAAAIGPTLKDIAATPFAKAVAVLRDWIDGQ